MVVVALGPKPVAPSLEYVVALDVDLTGDGMGEVEVGGGDEVCYTAALEARQIEDNVGL